MRRLQTNCDSVASFIRDAGWASSCLEPTHHPRNCRCSHGLRVPQQTCATMIAVRILLVGDVHGNTPWVTEHVLRGRARRERISLVLQLGDFGVWPGDNGQRYLNAVDRTLGEIGAILWFIDGNHEDFEQLLAVPVDDDGLRRIRPNIWHVPRAHRWNWGGRSFLACGGAGSVDVDDRVPRSSWWPQETITEADVMRCIERGPADVLVSHDAPEVVSRTFPRGAEHGVWSARGDALSRLSRERLDDITAAVSPSLILHGHWHHPHRTVVRDPQGNALVTAIGLNADRWASPGGRGHCAILDTDILEAAEDLAEAVTVVD